MSSRRSSFVEPSEVEGTRRASNSVTSFIASASLQRAIAGFSLFITSGSAPSHDDRVIFGANLASSGATRRVRLPGADVRHRSPRLLRRERRTLLEQLDRDAVRGAHEGHATVARRAVEGDT